MGVAIELDGKVYSGESCAAHQELVQQIVDKVIAIDGAQWLHHCDAAARSAQFADRSGDGDAFAQSAIDIFASRIIQLLRYGASPIVVRHPAKLLHTCRDRAGSRDIQFAVMVCSLRILLYTSACKPVSPWPQ